jgi:hypothetical protein
MIYLANFSREYCVEIEAETEEEAWEFARNMTPEQVEQKADGASPHLWSVAEME